MQRIRRTSRTRLRPGPLAALTLAWLAFATTVVRAHDPGLSALDVGISSGAVSVSLSMAAADVALVSPGLSTDSRQALTALVHESIRVSLDGEQLSSTDDEVTMDDAGARVRRAFAVPPSNGRNRRLTITSEVPKRLARGHRELLVVNMDGDPVTQALLDAESDSLAVDIGAAPAPAGRLAWSFLKLGNHHILSGYDHLLFLAGLFLAACTVRELVGLLTVFTIAHSISLALVVVGGVHLPSSIVEPLIAASIAWVGLENLVREGPRGRWLVVFGFGLIHGFGFAGALMDLGFGSTVADVALALLSFNIGVESGQLIVAAALLPVLWTIRSRPVWNARLMPLCSVLITVAGSYWLVVRLL